MNENRKPHVLVLRTAAVLLILVLLSSSMVAGRFARYTTSASGSDSARVAKFLVTQTGALTTAIKVEITPGQRISLEVEVKNDSEVAVEYAVTADNIEQNLPLEFTLTENDAPVASATAR